MMKKLVRAGKAFPSRFFVAVSLLLCLSANGASAAQTRKPAAANCDSPSYKNKPPCALESPTGQVTVFWPKLRMSNAVTRTLNSKIEVWIDKVKIGMVNGNTPLTVSLPNGAHKLELKPYDDYLENIRPTRETQITISAQKPLYFQVVDQGFVVTASELDAPTAQAVLSGNEPKVESNASTSQAALSGNEPKDERNALTSLAAVFGKEPKDKPNATTSPAVPAGNGTKMPSEPGTIYLYWPRPALGFGFLEKFATDLPVFLDGNRIGAVKLGEYLAIKVPSGEHALGLDVGLSNGRLLKQDFVLGVGSTRHFHVQNQDTFRLLEDSPEEAADYAKGLTQRQVSVQ